MDWKTGLEIYRRTIANLDEMIVFNRYFFQRLDRLNLAMNQQQLIGLVFPEKLKFEKGSLQTIAINPSSLS